MWSKLKKARYSLNHDISKWLNLDISKSLSHETKNSCSTSDILRDIYTRCFLGVPPSHIAIIIIIISKIAAASSDILINIYNDMLFRSTAFSYRHCHHRLRKRKQKQLKTQQKAQNQLKHQSKSLITGLWCALYLVSINCSN